MSYSLIFDIDGTLFQTEKILAKSLEDAFDYLRAKNEWDQETPIKQYQQIMGAPLPDVWKTLLPDHSEQLREHANTYFQQKLIENINRGKGALYPHVTDLFAALKERNCSIFIASNGLKNYLNAIIRFYNLDDWVTETFSIEQIETLNKADLVRKIVNKYQIEKAAVVGDRLSDIHAAKENGLTAIGCNFDYAKDDELAQADIVIDDLLELKKILGEID